MLMINANYQDKSLIIDILTQSFESNKSVNYIVKQDRKRIKRIKALMDYSFEVCYEFGEVFLSNDRKACALVLFPDQKRTTLKSIILDLKLIFSCVGLSNITKALSRESKIKQRQPKEPMYYIWFIGVDPGSQNSGIGSQLLKELLDESKRKQRRVFLETSTAKNIPWYQKFGFEVYDELDLSYKLVFLKKDII